MKTELKAAIAVILAGVSWGTLCIWVNRLTLAGLDSPQITCVRLIVATIIVWLMLLIKDPTKLKISPKDFYMFICTGVGSTTLYCLTYFYTIQHGEASIAVALTYTSPAFIVLLSALFYKVKITAQKMAAVILTFLGASLISGVAITAINIEPRVLLVGVSAGFFFSLYAVLNVKFLKIYDPLTVTAWTFLVAAICSLILNDGSEVIGVMMDAPTNILWGLGLGIVGCAIPYILYTWGLARMDAGKAGVLSAVEPIVGSVLGMTLLNESYEFVKILGITLIIAAIIVMNVNFKKIAN